MHSFGRYCAAAFVVLMVAEVCAQADLTVGTTPGPSHGDPSVPMPASKSVAGARYEVLLEQEQRVSTSPGSTAEDFRVVTNHFWSFVRRYPTSGFADNALWQAANLSADAFQRFSHDRDKYRALQLFQWLRDQYPHSPLQAKVLAQIEQFETMAATTPPAPTQAALR